MKKYKLSVLLLCITLIFGGALACDLGGTKHPTPVSVVTVTPQVVEAAPPPSLVTLSDGSQVPLPGDAELVPVGEGFYIGFSTALVEPQLFDFYAAWLSQRGWVMVAPTEAVVSQPHQRWRKDDQELLIELQTPDERGRTVVWLQVSSLVPPSPTAPMDILGVLTTPSAPTALPQPIALPTATLLPPPTAVPPPPTSPPTATTAVIQMTLEDRFMQVWQKLEDAENLLGQAVGPAVAADLVIQRFQHGLMLSGWQDDQSQPWVHVVIYDPTGNAMAGQEWYMLEDTWQPGDPEYPCAEAGPPYGPRGSFGASWCKYDYLRTALGNPMAEEETTSGGYQEFQRGLMMISGGDALVLSSTGVWRFESAE